MFRIQLPVGEISLDHLEPERPDPWRGGRLRSSGGRAAGEHGPLQRFGKQVVPECTGKPGTLHIRVVSDTGSAQANRGYPRRSPALIVLGPTVTVRCRPTAGEYLPLPWTEKRLMEVLGGDTDEPGARGSRPACRAARPVCRR